MPQQRSKPNIQIRNSLNGLGSYVRMDPAYITCAGLGADPALSYANRMSKSTFEWRPQGREEPLPASPKKDRAWWSWGGWVERWKGRSVEGEWFLCQIKGIDQLPLSKAWDVTIMLYQSFCSLAPLRIPSCKTLFSFPGPAVVEAGRRGVQKRSVRLWSPSTFSLRPPSAIHRT